MKNINNKLIKFIRTLSDKEILEFRKFLASPFFTNGRNYIPFLDEVLKISALPAKKEKLNKANPFIKKKNLSDQTLRNRYSELFKLGEEFLIYNKLKEDKSEKNRILANSLIDKKLYSFFNLVNQETNKHLSLKKFTIKKYQDISFFSQLNFIFLHDNNKHEEYYKEYYDNSKVTLCLNILSLLELGLEFSHQEFNNVKFSPNYIFHFLNKLEINDIINKFSKSDSVIEKVTSMYYKLYKAFENEDNEEYYFQSHKIFTKISNELNDDYKVIIYSHMINYCIRKQHKGNTKFITELFRLYNEKLEQGLISDFKNYHHLFNQFRDYIFIGILLKEYKWVEKFIESYSGELPLEIRENEKNSSLGYLHFSRKNYSKSLSYLINIKPSHYITYLDSSTIKLCNYFELKKYEDAFLELDNLRHYLKNHEEIPEMFKNNSNNFITYYQKLLKYKTDIEKPESKILKKNLTSITNIARKNWLLEKINEI